MYMYFTYGTFVSLQIWWVVDFYKGGEHKVGLVIMYCGNGYAMGISPQPT